MTEWYDFEWLDVGQIAAGFLLGWLGAKLHRWWLWDDGGDR